jgi:ABC-type Zn2+ transport system substrate-binding protein/surface adhesin
MANNDEELKQLIQVLHESAITRQNNLADYNRQVDAAEEQTKQTESMLKEMESERYVV